MTVPGERWRLDRDLTIGLATTAFSASPHCWLRPSEQGRVCVESALIETDRIRLAGAIDGVELGGIASRFEDAQRIAGPVAGRWDVAADAGRWRGTAHLQTEGLRLIGDDAGSTDSIELPVLSATVELADGRAQVSLHADFDASRVVDVEVTAFGFDGAAPIEGRATVAIADLAFIATFTRRVGETGGALHGDFVIGGTVSAPELRGTLAVVNGRIALTEPRVDLTNVDVAMQLRGADEWTIRGSAQSDKGRVTIAGTLRDPLRDSRALHAHVDATDLPVSIPDATVRVAGGIDVDWRRGLFGVKGRVEIPRAEIRLSQLPAGAVEISDDVVVVDRVEARPVGTRAEVDLEVVLRDHVRFTAFGLDSGLTGTLRLRQSADGIAQLNGTLSLIDGRFEMYGQKLAIESGRLTFTGPPQDPYVDATASRTIREATRTVTVGARIQGPARAIETTLFSKPAMSDAEALSYLVLGRPLDSATA
jgi:translocation and assembly module TamB